MLFMGSHGRILLISIFLYVCGTENSKQTINNSTKSDGDCAIQGFYWIICIYR